MKCLAFVDLHGDRKAYKDLKKKIRRERPDFLVCAGDITIFENEVRELMHKLSKLNGKVFIIHGNHEEERVVKGLSRQYKNIEFVHQRIAKYNNIIIMGWGGGGFTIRDVEFEAWEKSIKKELKRYKKEGKKIIFVSHAPFYNTNLDFLGHEHHGNKSFANFIRYFKADIGICGHFHENAGKEGRIKNCRVFNPGPKGRIIEI